MRWPTWAAVLVAGVQAALLAVGMARRDEALGMLAGLLTPLTLGAIAFAIVSRVARGRR